MLLPLTPKGWCDSENCSRTLGGTLGTQRVLRGGVHLLPDSHRGLFHIPMGSREQLRFSIESCRPLGHTLASKGRIGEE